MSNPHPYTPEEIAKLGNTLIFLVERMGQLSKTKLLKLVYLIQESAVERHGLPFFNMPFTVWKFGPVAADLFVDLSEESPVLLANFVCCQSREGMTLVQARRSFNDDEFSDNEISLLEGVVQRYQKFSADQLVAHTHRVGSLWHKTASEHGVLKYLELGMMNRTEFEIDFGRLLDDMPEKQHFYQDQLEYIAQSSALKEHV